MMFPAFSVHFTWPIPAHSFLSIDAILKGSLPCPLPPCKLDPPVYSLHSYLIEFILFELIYLCPYLSSASPPGNISSRRAGPVPCSVQFCTHTAWHMGKCLNICWTNEWMKGHCRWNILLASVRGERRKTLFMTITPLVAKLSKRQMPGLPRKKGRGNRTSIITSCPQSSQDTCTGLCFVSL